MGRRGCGREDMWDGVHVGGMSCDWKDMRKGEERMRMRWE